MKRKKPESEEKNENKEDRQRQELFEKIASLTHEDVDWSCVGGLREVKSRLNEALIQPLLRPDLFQGSRAPPKGVLLFGPPGNGKTLIAKCIATELSKQSTTQNKKCTFLSVQSSDLMSKWVGESEKSIKALFDYAEENQPAVIFVDEIDSVFQKRTEESKMTDVRIINEFLTRLDGVGKSKSSSVYMIGATNRPNMIDDAALRRLTLKFYIPLPDADGITSILKHQLGKLKHALTEKDFLAMKINLK